MNYDKSQELMAKVGIELPRSSFYYRSLGEDEYNLQLMRLLDEQFTRRPLWGPEDAGLAEDPGSPGQSQENQPVDAENGSGGDLPKAAAVFSWA